MEFVDYGIGYSEEKEHYLYLKNVSDNDAALLRHLGFEPLDSNDGRVMDAPDIETWVKYEDRDVKSKLLVSLISQMTDDDFTEEQEKLLAEYETSIWRVKINQLRLVDSKLITEDKIHDWWSDYQFGDIVEENLIEYLAETNGAEKQDSMEDCTAVIKALSSKARGINDNVEFGLSRGEAEDYIEKILAIVAPKRQCVISVGMVEHLLGSGPAFYLSKMRAIIETLDGFLKSQNSSKLNYCDCVDCMFSICEIGVVNTEKELENWKVLKVVDEALSTYGKDIVSVDRSEDDIMVDVNLCYPNNSTAYMTSVAKLARCDYAALIKELNKRGVGCCL